MSLLSSLHILLFNTYSVRKLAAAVVVVVVQVEAAEGDKSLADVVAAAAAGIVDAEAVVAVLLQAWLCGPPTAG